MKPRIESRLVRVLGSWQILDGIVTIIFYGLFKRYQFSQLTDLTYENAKAMESLAGSAFIFISIFGTILIGLGLFNLVVAKRYLKEAEVNMKWLIWLGGMFLFSLIIMDIISVIISAISIVLIVAKRQALKKYRITDYSRSL